MALISIRLLIIVFVCTLIFSNAVQAQQGNSAMTKTLSAEDIKEKRLKWFREARFGMFIHWGLYAVPADEWKGKLIPGIGEWIMNRAKIPVAEYELLAPQFNPVKFGLTAAAWPNAGSIKMNGSTGNSRSQNPEHSM